MCGDAPKVDTSYQDYQISEAERARREEAARQNRIDYGMRQIKAIFEGGRAPGAQSAAKGPYDPKATYYLSDGSVWTPEAQKEVLVPPASAGGGAGVPTVPRVGAFSGGPLMSRSKPRQDDQGRWFTDDAYTAEGGQTRTRRTYYDAPAGGGATPGKGTVTLTGLTPEQQFEKMAKDLLVRGKGKRYDGAEPLLAARRQAQENFYFPQLDENRSEASDELAFALARAGLSTSTTANERKAKLRAGYNRERAGIAADIDADISQAEAGLQQTRQSLEAQLRSSADATAATDAALAARTTFAADAPELNTLENTLLGFSQGIGGAAQGYQTGQIRTAARGGSTVNRDRSRVIQ